MPLVCIVLLVCLIVCEGTKIPTFGKPFRSVYCLNLSLPYRLHSFLEFVMYFFSFCEALLALMCFSLIKRLFSV